MVELIRSVDPQLLKKLIDIEISNFGADAGLNEWTLVPLIRHGRVFAIWNNGEPLGLCQYILDWDKARSAYLVGLSIKSEFRNKGYAIILMTESMKCLSQNMVEEVELTVSPDNKPALSLYRNKLGFSITEVRENEYGPGQHRLVMSRRISTLSRPNQ